LSLYKPGLQQQALQKLWSTAGQGRCPAWYSAMYEQMNRLLGRCRERHKERNTAWATQAHAKRVRPPEISGYTSTSWCGLVSFGCLQRPRPTNSPTPAIGFSASPSVTSNMANMRPGVAQSLMPERFLCMWHESRVRAAHGWRKSSPQFAQHARLSHKCAQ